jgi:hypothetical protein
VQPTEHYALFETAESLGKTVAELLTGQAGALSNMELYLWNRWRWARERLRQQDMRQQNKR